MVHTASEAQDSDAHVEVRPEAEPLELLRLLIPLRRDLEDVSSGRCSHPLRDGTWALDHFLYWLGFWAGKEALAADGAGGAASTGGDDASGMNQEPLKDPQ